MRKILKALFLTTSLLSCGVAQAADYSVSACLANRGQPTAAYVSQFPAPSTNAPVSEPEACSKRGERVWTMPIRSTDVGKPFSEVVKRSEFHTVWQSNLDRTMRVVMVTLDDGRQVPAIRVTLPEGQVPTSGIVLEPFDDGVDHACVRMMMHVNSAFEWSEMGAKLPLGLWIGGSPFRSTGGTPPSCQDGSTVRLWTTGAARGEGLRLYSYDLSRRTNSTTGGTDACGLTRYFGSLSDTSETMPRSWWMPVEIEVKLNTPGYADGFARLYVDGYQAAEMTGMVFRCGSEWSIRGITLPVFFGGNPAAPEFHSPKTQSFAVRGFSIYRL